MNSIIVHPTQSNNAANLTVVSNNTKEKSSFIEANSEKVSLSQLKQNHIIPTHRDGNPLISHADLIELTSEMTHKIFAPERILPPSIRISHPVFGRVPEAKNKKLNELEDWEKTTYYERLAFVIEVASITDIIGGNKICLSIGGVRKYEPNLRTGADQHFKLFAGYQVTVCSNQCVWSDGYLSNVRVKNISQLKEAIYGLLVEYDAIAQLKKMEAFEKYSLTEQQFGHLIGKARLYQYLPNNIKSIYPQFLFSDSQVNTVARDYYKDEHFCREFNGEVSLWKVYNLLTGSNKSSYIDCFLPRAANASSFVQGLATSLEENSPHWFLS